MPLSRLEQLRALNSNELNQTCRKHLKLGEGSEDLSELYCLSLALWGLTELDLRFPADGPSEDEMLEMLDCLMYWPPYKAYEWLTNENGSYGEESNLSTRDLVNIDPESAAYIVLEAMRHRMEELGPDRYA